jgi:hypothetical protein
VYRNISTSNPSAIHADVRNKIVALIHHCDVHWPFHLPGLLFSGRYYFTRLCECDHTFLPGELAERYGYVNRALPDADLDAFVDALATRIASFDKRAISETKRFADVASLPPDYEIAPEWDVCLASIMRPAAQKRIGMLMERGFHQPGDVENRLGYHVGQLGR